MAIKEASEGSAVFDKSRLTRTFDEWKRRYQENPESFTPVGETDSSYGEDCVVTLTKIYNELPED
jgi:hypothetical protein